MEAMIVFLAFSVFIFGGIIMVQLYMLYKRRKQIDVTRRQLEELLVRDCSNAISRFCMSFHRVPKQDVGYLTQVRLSHEAQMSEFYLALGGATSDVLGYAKFSYKENHGHKSTFVLSEILPATAPAPCPVLSLNNEVFTMNDAVSAHGTIDQKLDQLIHIRTSLSFMDKVHVNDDINETMPL